jgi:peptidyl-tRNA hydrolase
MYLVVRKDLPLSFGGAMALAGAGAVRCVDRFAEAPAWREQFAAWSARPRKVALRASAEELAALAAGEDAADVALGGDPALLCLPPCRRSERPGLAVLRPYTDGPRPREAPPPPAAPALTYVIRPGVLRTAGKAMAQAGHAALACAERFGGPRAPALAAWRAAGEPGLVLAADPAAWTAARAAPAAVVVRDAGLTQVAPDTETVVAFPPGVAPPGEGECERVP